VTLPIRPIKIKVAQSRLTINWDNLSEAPVQALPVRKYYLRAGIRVE
jgi:hypothetical protein